MTSVQTLGFQIFRKSRLHEEEPVPLTEKEARSALSAWRNVENSLKRLGKGQQVITPYHIYFAKK